MEPTMHWRCLLLSVDGNQTVKPWLNQETLLRSKCFPVQPRGKHMLRKQILPLRNKKCFCLESKTFLLPGHKFCVRNMFPSLATMKTMLISFQCCSLKKFFPATASKQIMADGEGEIEGKGKKERNRKDEDRELLIALYDYYGMQLMRTA